MTTFQSDPMRKSKHNPEGQGCVTISLYTHAYTDTLGPLVSTNAGAMGWTGKAGWTGATLYGLKTRGLSHYIHQ